MVKNLSFFFSFHRRMERLHNCKSYGSYNNEIEDIYEFLVYYYFFFFFPNF